MQTHISTAAARRFAAAVSSAGLAALLAACGPTTTGATPVPSRSPVVTTVSASPSVLPPPPTPAPTPSATPTATATATATHHAAPTPTHRPTTARPAPAPTHRASKKPAPTKAATTCEIVSNAGNCYQAGQFCRAADLGRETHDAAGRLLRCAEKSGRPHWGYA